MMRGKNISVLPLLLLKIVYSIILISLIPLSEALISCKTDEECQQLLKLPGKTTCVDGHCSNPYQNGCLTNRMPGWTKTRICNSEDPLNAESSGLCRKPIAGLEYTEIRIAGQNWESVFFEAWILQILLSEMLDVPTTIETGVPNTSMNFYDAQARLDYGVPAPFDGLELATEIGDCRKIERNVSMEDYRPCCHVITESWSSHIHDIERLTESGIIEPHSFVGVVGIESWFVPRFTAERDPTILSYLGLTGKQNRQKLAAIFKRPTTWEDYCNFVSKNNCLYDDGVAIRAPQEQSEHGRYFVEGLYNGYFRKTEENDCGEHPQNCTGHIADFPCGWNSYVKPLTHHLDIALSSSGGQPGSNGYSYSELVEIWLAANATKSDVIAQWRLPDALYQSFLGTDAEFQFVQLPPASHKCQANRVNPKARCEGTFEEQVGHPAGACDAVPSPVNKIVAAGLYRDTYNMTIPEARQSPGYEAVKNFQIDGFQLDEIFEFWQSIDFDKWNLDPRDAVCRWIVENYATIENFVPRTHPRVMRNKGKIDGEPLSKLAIGLGLLAVLSVLASSAITYWKRHKRVMLNAQVGFLGLLLAGLLFVSLGAVLQSLTPTDTGCVTVVWLLNIGYTLELVPLVVKIAAINRLMAASRRMKRVKLQRKDLYGAVAFLSAIVVVFMICWTVIDPPRSVMTYTLTDEKTAEGDTIIFIDYVCQSNASHAWGYAGSGAQILCLLSASVLAIQTRNVRSDFNESQTLAVLIYSHFIFVTGRVLFCIFAASWDVILTTQLVSLLYTTDSLATLVIYFVPKFLEKKSKKTSGSMTYHSNTFSANAVNTETSDARGGFTSYASNRQPEQFLNE